LLIAALGGIPLGLSGFPAGYLSGAIIAVSTAALLGRPTTIPDKFARVFYVIMGISFGGTVTPETVKGMATWPLSLALLSLAMVLLTVAVTAYLRYVHKWDPGSALLGAFPGGLATVMVLAVETNADVRAIAVVQTVRVVAIAVLLPSAIALFGLTGEPIVPKASALDDPWQLFLLVGVSSAAALMAQKARFPGGLIFGAMVSSAILHGTGWVSATLPTWFAISSFVVLGAITGTRFAHMDVRMLRHLAASAFGALAVGMTVAFLGAAGAAWLLSLNTGPMLIAYAPGAIDAMMVLALALHYDPAFVGAHHLSRFILVLAAMPAVVSFTQRMQRKECRKPGGDDPPASA
jgi:membrane AbrB-like protein